MEKIRVGDRDFLINIKKKAISSYKKSHIDYITENIKKHQCKYISHIDNNGNIEYTLLCERKNKKFIIGYSNLRIRILSDLEISPYFRPIYGKSEMEKNMLNFICDNYANEILNDDRYKDNMMKMRAKVRQAGGENRAVELINDLLKEKLGSD